MSKAMINGPKTLKQHLIDLQSVVDAIAEWRRLCNEELWRDPESKGRIPLPYLSSGVRESTNTVRRKRYQRHCVKFEEMNCLNSIISIEALKDDSAVVVTEPKVSMEELFQFCVGNGYLPEVCPEFKGITVGGAISGSAIESSSFKFGQFCDACVSYEVVLSTGTVVSCSDQMNADLFLSLSSSLGTIALVTLAVVRCMKYKPFVVVKFKLGSFSEAVDTLNSHTTEDTSSDVNEVDFLEGVALSRHRVVTMEGKLVDENLIDSGPLSTFSQSSWNAEWFYWNILDVAALLDDGNNGTEHVQIIPTADYLVRWDLGSFWMGEHLMRPSLRFMLRWSLTRYLFGWFFTNTNLYKELNKTYERKYLSHFFMQDCFVPIGEAESFVNSLEEGIGIFPLWLCPVRAPHRSKRPLKVFAPHCSRYLKKGEDMMLNVGIYGTPFGELPVKYEEYNTRLERIVYTHRGRKMLYSCSFYSYDQFRQIYDMDLYEEIRNKFDSKRGFLNIFDKICFYYYEGF